MRAVQGKVVFKQIPGSAKKASIKLYSGVGGFEKKKKEKKIYIYIYSVLQFLKVHTQDLKKFNMVEQNDLGIFSEKLKQPAVVSRRQHSSPLGAAIIVGFQEERPDQTPLFSFLFHFASLTRLLPPPTHL